MSSTSKESYQQISERISKLVSTKNEQYGSAYLKVKDFLSILYPNGITSDQYIPVLLLVRIFDKMMRISQGFFEDSFADIAGYGLLGEKEFGVAKEEGLFEKEKELIFEQHCKNELVVLKEKVSIWDEMTRKKDIPATSLNTAKNDIANAAYRLVEKVGAA